MLRGNGIHFIPSTSDVNQIRCNGSRLNGRQEPLQGMANRLHIVFQCARKTGSRGVWLAIQLKAMEGSIQLQCACLCFGNAEQKRIRRYRGNTIIHGRGIMTVPRGRTPDSALLFSRVARLDGEYQTIHHLYSGGNDWCSILVLQPFRQTQLLGGEGHAFFLLLWKMAAGTISKTRYNLTVTNLMMGLIVKGIMENCRSYTFPLIKEYFNVSYDKYGLFTSCLSVFYVMATLMCTLMSSFINYKWVFIVAYGCMVVGSFCLLFAKSFGFAAFCIMLMWLGHGFFDVGANASSTLIFTKNTGVMMSLMHFYYGVGALLGPNITSWSVKWLGNSFYSAYLVLLVICILTLIATILLPFDLPEGSPFETKKNAESMTISKSFKIPLIYIASLAIGPLLLTEQSGSAWAPLYLIDVLGYSNEKDIPKFTSAMYVIFTVGRLISGPFIEKLGYYTSMFTSIIGCFVFLLVGFCVGRAGIFFFAVTGFFYSSFWPIFICIVMRLFKKDSAVATSVILVVQGVIMLPANYILGLINEHVGVQWAYRGSMFLCFWSFCVMLFIHRTQKKIDAKSKSEGVEMSSLNDRPKKDSGDGKDVVVEMVTPVPPATKEEGVGSSESAVASGSVPVSSESVPAATQDDHLASTTAASVEGV